MKPLAWWLLLILAVPLAACAITAPIEMDRTTRSNLFAIVGGACFVVGFVAVSIFAIRSERLRKRTPKVSEELQRRDDIAAALWMASLIDSISLTIGGPVVQVGLIITGAAMLWTLIWLPRRMRHLGIRTTVLIGRDQSTVFSFLADERNGPKYIPELESVEKITDEPIGPGTRFRSRLKVSEGKVFEGVDEVVDYQPPNQMSTRVINAARPNLEVMTFESVPAGTRLMHRFDSEITYPAALLHQGVMRPLMQLDMKSRRQKAWAQLKLLLESSAAT